MGTCRETGAVGPGAAVTVIVNDGADISSHIVDGPDGRRAVLRMGGVDLVLSSAPLTLVLREMARAQHTLGTLERGATPPG